MLAVFLDIEKAYDTVFRNAVLFKLLKLGINGPIFWFIKAFLSDRTFQVRISTFYSKVYEAENGIPQGSTLSPILFSLMINDLSDCIDCPVALYADDCCFFQVGKNVVEIHKCITKNLRQIHQWSNKWGLKIPPTKSAVILFTRLKKLPKLQLTIGDVNIPFKTEYKYLGVFFQSNENYNKHVNYIIEKYQRSMNVLRYIKGTSWGASKLPMVFLYRALI